MSGTDEKHAPSIVARTVKGFCHAYGPSRSGTYKLIAAGKLETRKIGTRTYILEESALRLFAVPTTLPTSEVKTSVDAGRHAGKRPYHKSRKTRTSG